MKTPFYVFGAGGHTKCVIEAAIASGIRPDATFDDCPEINNIFGIPVFKTSEFTLNKPFSFIVAIGNCQVRREKFELLIAAGGQPQTVIHPRAYISPSAQIGRGTVALHFSTADTGTRIGDNVILNIGCIVGHDGIVEDHAHVSGNVTLCGGARIRTGAWVGAGASVRQRLEIGENAFVGLGSTVVKDVPPRITVCNPVAASPLVKNGNYGSTS